MFKSSILIWISRCSTESTAGNSKQVDLFGQSLVGDLMDAPVPVPTEMAATNSNSSEVDLFADATFVSASPNIEAGGECESQVRFYDFIYFL